MFVGGVDLTSLASADPPFTTLYLGGGAQAKERAHLALDEAGPRISISCSMRSKATSRRVVRSWLSVMGRYGSSTSPSPFASTSLAVGRCCRSGLSSSIRNSAHRTRS